jgi:cytidylate kinase
MTVIAIDGPAASGKSSAAKKLARRLGFSYVNSGAMYRAITWELLRQLIDPARTENGESFIRINSQIPDIQLRDIEVNQNVSPVSAIPAVRELISTRLHNLAEGRNVVMEGRDIGTAVFPETPHKFYLDASPEIRRRRRAAQGQNDSIEHRDKIDSTRRAAPLAIAADAHVLDTSHLTLEGVVDNLVEVLRKSGIQPA